MMVELRLGPSAGERSIPAACSATTAFVDVAIGTLVLLHQPVHWAVIWAIVIACLCGLAMWGINPRRSAYPNVNRIGVAKPSKLDEFEAFLASSDDDDEDEETGRIAGEFWTVVVWLIGLVGLAGYILIGSLATVLMIAVMMMLAESVYWVHAIAAVVLAIAIRFALDPAIYNPWARRYGFEF